MKPVSFSVKHPSELTVHNATRALYAIFSCEMTELVALRDTVRLKAKPKELTDLIRYDIEPAVAEEVLKSFRVIVKDLPESDFKNVARLI